ncbi:MAG: hypothetical protein ACKPKO_02665, partial [Candidatus Fonsibacter sp.]
GEEARSRQKTFPTRLGDGEAYRDNTAEIRPRQSQGAAAVLDRTQDGKGLQRQVHQSAEGKLTTRGTNEFKQLYRSCMTDAIFKERELKAPGYLDRIYILDWTAIGADAAQPAPADPEETPKRASGDKVAIQFKYCSHQLD